MFNLEPQTFEIQKQHWGENMLNYESIIAPFKDAIFTEDHMFIRPIEDSKSFAGKIISKEEFEAWQHSIVKLKEDYGQGQNFGDQLIQISSIKKIYAEYRFWIVDQQIICGSLYKRGDKVIYSPK